MSERIINSRAIGGTLRRFSFDASRSQAGVIRPSAFRGAPPEVVRLPLHRPDDDAIAFHGDDLHRRTGLEHDALAFTMLPGSIDEGQSPGIEQRQRFADLSHEPLQLPLLLLIGSHLVEGRGFQQDLLAEFGPRQEIKRTAQGGRDQNQAVR